MSETFVSPELAKTLPDSINPEDPDLLNFFPAITYSYKHLRFFVRNQTLCNHTYYATRLQPFAVVSISLWTWKCTYML